MFKCIIYTRNLYICLTLFYVSQYLYHLSTATYLIQLRSSFYIHSLFRNDAALYIIRYYILCPDFRRMPYVILNWLSNIFQVQITALNDSKLIAISIYNVTILCIVGVAVSFLIADDPAVLYTFTSSIVVFCTFITLLIVFLPKVNGLVICPQYINGFTREKQFPNGYTTKV